jgi:hypothetical protein
MDSDSSQSDEGGVNIETLPNQAAEKAGVAGNGDKNGAQSSENEESSHSGHTEDLNREYEAIKKKFVRRLRRLR